MRSGIAKMIEVRNALTNDELFQVGRIYTRSEILRILYKNKILELGETMDNPAKTLTRCGWERDGLSTKARTRWTRPVPIPDPPAPASTTPEAESFTTLSELKDMIQAQADTMNAFAKILLGTAEKVDQLLKELGVKP